MVGKVRSGTYGRGAERGATLFVVVLAITMLTGIGLYTVHSAALLARASGNQRQAEQTEYLAQMGVLAGLSVISTAPQSYIPQALSGTDDCRNNLGIDTTIYKSPSCLELSSDGNTLLTGHTLFSTDTFGTAIDPKTSAPALNGRFHTEVTDVFMAYPVTGMDVVNRNAFHYYEAKLTTTAQLQPAGAAAGCVQDLMQVAAQHSTRAHVLVGPLGGI